MGTSFFETWLNLNRQMTQEDLEDLKGRSFSSKSLADLAGTGQPSPYSITRWDLVGSKYA